MADKQEQAARVYNDLCAMCDEMELKYERHDDDNYVVFTVVGEDLPMKIGIFVNAERELIRLLSLMPLTVPDEHISDIAIAVSIANFGMVDGSFDYDLSDGSIRFRMTASYMDSIIGKELFHYMIVVAAGTIDDYNDKFLMLSKGMMTLEQFIESEEQKDQ